MAKKIRINPNGWTYEQFNLFTQLFKDGQFDKAGRLARFVIVEWPYDVELSGNDPLAELPLPDALEVLRTIFNTLGDYAQTISTAGYEVNLRNWTWRDFSTFQQLLKAENVEEVSEMVVSVVLRDGEPLELPLSLQDGIAAFKAVNDAVSKVLSGKN